MMIEYIHKMKWSGERMSYVKGQDNHSYSLRTCFFAGRINYLIQLVMPTLVLMRSLLNRCLFREASSRIAYSERHLFHNAYKLTHIPIAMAKQPPGWLLVISFFRMVPCH